MSSIVLYGPPGGGKTTMAATMTDLGYRCIWLDFDRKVKLMKNLDAKVKAGLIEIREPASRLVEGALNKKIKAGPKAPLKEQPKGYLEFADMLTDLEENPPKDSKNYVLVLDSLTRVLEHYKRWLLYEQKKTHFVFEDWGFLLSALEDVFDFFFGLQPDIYAHAIIICHDQKEQDELTGQVRILPLIDGQMKSKIGSYVEEMYYNYVEVGKDGRADYSALTVPMNKVSQARTSRELATLVEPDFSVIYEEEKHVYKPTKEVKTKRK